MPDPPAPAALDVVIEELRRLRGDLQNQDNRITSGPVFMVQVCRRIYGIDEKWDPSIAWTQDDYTLTKEAPGEDPSFDELEAEYERTGKEDGDWTRTGYVERWENVQPFLTERGAEAYIKLNGHNLGGPHRIYVESGYRNEEWQMLRRLFLDGALLAALAAERSKRVEAEAELADTKEELLIAGQSEGEALGRVTDLESKLKQSESRADAAERELESARVVLRRVVAGLGQYESYTQLKTLLAASRDARDNLNGAK